MYREKERIRAQEEEEGRNGLPLRLGLDPIL